MSQVLAFGEALWDHLPRGRYLGGAPLNVCYHLARLEVSSTLVSSIGRDAAGDDLLEAMRWVGLSTLGVSRHPTLPTGKAEVKVSAAGEPTFHLAAPVAWDEIEVESVAAHLASSPSVLLFGSLPLRSAGNRRACERLLEHFPEATVVCDLNLRPPFDDLEPLAPFVRRAAILKVNANEAERLAGRAITSRAEAREAAESIHERYGCKLVCVTLGEHGAGLLSEEGWLEADAPKIVVRDAVGAGDAFTAAVVAGWVKANGRPEWGPVLAEATALGAWVASRDGAQPAP